MPRGKHIAKRVITPDPVYKSELLAKFINTVMERGKKSVAQKSSTAPWNQSKPKARIIAAQGI